MTENKTFLLITAIVNKANMAEVQPYLASVMPVFGKNGGKPFGRFTAVEQLIGEEGPEMVGIIEFPSVEVIKQTLASQDFLALSDARDRAFQKLNMVICQNM